MVCLVPSQKLIITAIKRLFNTIKMLHRLECFPCTAIVGKNEFLYHNNKEPLNLLHNFSPPFLFLRAQDEQKKFSGFFRHSCVAGCSEKKFCWCKKENRAALPSPDKKPREEEQQKWLLIRLAIPNLRHSPENKTESFCVGKRIIIL